MKNLLISILLITCCGLCYAQNKTVYVSSSIGLDTNDGSVSSPLKTVSKALSTKANKILLKRGDVFYEKLVVYNKNIDAYGEGSLPEINGLKTIKAGDATWVEGRFKGDRWTKKRGTGIWRIDLTDPAFSGRSDKSELYLNDIGFVVDDTKGKIYGHKCEFLYAKDCNDKKTGPQRNTYLKNEGDFYQTSEYGNDVDKNEFRYLYIKLSYNPNRSSFSFSTFGTGVALTNSSIKNLKVTGFSGHGVKCGKNATVDHCIIDLVGGSQAMYYSAWGRYGNGIEFYVTMSDLVSNGLATNNIISRTFDCATTVQGSSGSVDVVHDIRIENNCIIDCRQAFEFFLSNPKPQEGKTNTPRGCTFKNNLCIGDNSNIFSSPEARDTFFLSFHSVDGAFPIENNVCVGRKGFLTAASPKSLKFKNNVYHTTDDIILWNNGGINEKTIYLAKSDKNNESKYRNTSGDVSTSIKIYSSDSLDELRERLINDYIGKYWK